MFNRDIEVQDFSEGILAERGIGVEAAVTVPLDVLGGAGVNWVQGQFLDLHCLADKLNFVVLDVGVLF